MNALVLSAIDIGATHSYFMYAYRHEPERINTYYGWKSSSRFNEKAPIIVLFNKNKEFHSFGFEAENHFRSLRNDEERKRWYYFEGFGKVASDSPVDSTLSDVNGKKMETYKVYGSAIKFFRNTIFDLYAKGLSRYEVSDLHLVMIVPAIFRKSYRRILQQSFHYAGIKDYSIVRETDAVLSYWKYEWCKQTELPDLTDGQYFLIVNLRGRTATITAQKAPGGIIKRLHNVTGGGWGGQAVNEELKQLFIKIVGAPVFLKFVEENEDDWKDTERDIEYRMQSLCPESSGKISVHLPVILKEMYNESFKETIQDAVKESPYATNISCTAATMKIDVSVLKNLFYNAMKTIISNIKDTLMNDAVKEKKVEVIILVGGFSDSPLVQDAIKQAFPDHKVLFPEQPAITTLKGAVLYGHYTHNITEPAKPGVVSKFTYGVQFCHINEEGGRSEVERSETKIFFRKGELVYEKDKITWRLHLEAGDEEHFEVQFFASPRNETVSIDEENVKYLKKIRVDSDGSFAQEVVIRIYQRDSRFSGDVSGQYVGFDDFE